MKTSVVCAAFASLCLAPLALATPAEDLAAAARKLADAPNYAWASTVENAGGGGGGGGRFGGGPSSGVAEKAGYALITRDGPNGKMLTVVQGEKRVIETPSGWMTGEEMRAQFQGGGGGGGGRGMGGMFMGAALPAAEVAALATAANDLKSADGALTGDLPLDQIARLLAGGRPGGNSPEPKDASGTVTFWVKDGAIVKYAVHVKGTIAGRDGEPRMIDRTTTTEISGVGSTKVEVPEAAKTKIGS